MIVHDISPRLSPRIAVWPGDVPLSQSWQCRIDEGSNLDLSALTATVHLGAHADAPRHYAADAEDIASRPLARYLGTCRVIAVDVGRGERIRPEHLGDAPLDAPRVLFRTGTFPDPEDWNVDFASLSPELVDHLADAGVTTVGIDTPSIDLFDDKVLLSHTAVARRDLAVLEGLVLADVAPGTYTLIALPLPLEGFDASPVRAVLVEGPIG